MAKKKNLMLYGNIIFDVNANLINGYVSVTNLSTNTEICSSTIDLDNNNATYTIFINASDVDLIDANGVSVNLELYDDTNNMYTSGYRTLLSYGETFNDSPSIMNNFIINDNDRIIKENV